MKSHSFLITFLAVLPIISVAQSRWGIEFKGDRITTHNSGQLEGGSYEFSYYTVINESDLNSFSQSLGVLYKLNDRNLLKLHVGAHQNGSIFSYSKCQNTGQCDTFNNVNLVFHYFQVSPSYTFRILNHKLIIPIEAGINFNVATDENSHIVGVDLVNYDYELSTGLDYQLDSNLIIGLHALFIGNINGYQGGVEQGSFLPKSIGAQFSILYEFEKPQKAENHIQ